MTVAFTKLVELNQDVLRNIVSVLSIQSAFDDLTEDSGHDVFITAENAMTRVMHGTDSYVNDLYFHYTAAIDYPFATDHFMATRYSDGTFPVWYGAIDKITSIYETAYHMYQREMMVEGSESIIEIIRDRMIYDVRCEAMLIDLTNSDNQIEQLTQNEYSYTQTIGKKLYDQGFTGLLAPSARYSSGVNVNIFKSNVLKQPSVNCLLRYHLFPSQQRLDVYQNEKVIHAIHW